MEFSLNNKNMDYNQNLNILIAVSGTAFGALIGFLSQVLNNIAKYGFELKSKKLDYLNSKLSKLEATKLKFSQKKDSNFSANDIKWLINESDYPSFVKNKELLLQTEKYKIDYDSISQYIHVKDKSKINLDYSLFVNDFNALKDKIFEIDLILATDPEREFEGILDNLNYPIILAKNIISQIEISINNELNNTIIEIERILIK